MRLRTCQISEDELTMREYVFAFSAESMIMRFMTYRENVRTSEFSPWVEKTLWNFSIESFDAPVEVPDWAESEIKKQILNLIKVE